MLVRLLMVNIIEFHKLIDLPMDSVTSSFTLIGFSWAAF